MVEVRCPKCGTSVPDGRRRTARCPACREALGTCRYCRHYDTRTQDCTHLNRREIDHIVDPDEVLECPEFASRLAPTPAARGLRALLRTSLITLLAVSALAMLAIVVARRGERATGGQPLLLRVSAPDTVLRDEGLDLQVSVVNGGTRDLSHVEVRVGGRGMRGLTLQSLDPPQSFLDAREGSVSAGQETLPAGDAFQVTFHLRASQEGRTALVVSALSATTSGVITQSAETDVLP